MVEPDVYTMNRMARHKFDKGTIIANSLRNNGMQTWPILANGLLTIMMYNIY